MCASCGFAYAPATFLANKYEYVLPLDGNSYSRLATYRCYNSAKFDKAFKDAFDIDIKPGRAGDADIKEIASWHDQGVDKSKFKADFVEFAGKKIPFTAIEVKNSSCNLAYSNNK